MKRESIFTAMLLVFLSPGIIARAQIPAPPPAPEVQLRSGAELDQLLGPIALYPDPLMAQILPAATLPSEIVLADRYVNGGGDPNFIDQQPWDPSVKALARYPAVLKWMDDNLAWTTALGQAFLYQQQDVMASIQRLRAQAQALGNLQTTPQENVIIDNGIIEVVPANPQMIYVPVYQPDVVYFQRPFGNPFISFGLGFSVGAHDGLYWSTRTGDELSPLGLLVAQARVEGYRKQTKILTEEQSPYHGYYFQILTRQGKHAPGGKYNYIINGHMIAGFALVAWPAEWGNTGVMTFLVNQRGKVYQKNLGPKTSSIAKAMTTYDPDNTWTLTREE
jgi:hypothetical protein